MASSSPRNKLKPPRVRCISGPVDVMAPTRSKTRKAIGSPVVRDVLRRLKALERRLQSRQTPKRQESDEWRVRWNIIEEDLLRRGIAADQVLRKKDPDLWKRLE